MSRVFFVQPDDRINMESAGSVGEVRFMIDDIISPFEPEGWISAIDKALETADFDPDTDYFGLSGDHRIVAFALAVLVRIYGKVRILVFDAKSESYRTREFDTTNVLTAE